MPPRLRPEGASLFPKASRIVQDSGKVSLESAVASLSSFGLAREVATPASDDEDAGVNENSATLKLA